MSFDEMLDTSAAAATATATKPRRGLALELKRAPKPMAGGSPQVSLLPRELRDAQRNRGMQRALAGVLLLAVAATAGGVLAANAHAGAAQDRLAAATDRSQQLSTQVLQFADVQALQQRIALAEAGVLVGSSTQIDWRKQLLAITAEMPAGFTVTTIAADGATPVDDYPQGDTPLDVARAATVSITASTASIAELPTWLRQLRSLPAYADVTPQVTGGSDDAGFNVLVTLHLTEKAFVTPTGAEQ